MIISASRRTDIPAFYSPWFYNRLKEGYVCVRNPRNYHQVSRIPVNRQVVDGFVFWTKNPLPMLQNLSLLADWPFYFQFTLTPYGKAVEPGLPSKEQVLIPAFIELAGRTSPSQVVWRYDPIFFSETYSLSWHVNSFRSMASQLAGATRLCIISFLDYYRNTQTRTAHLNLFPSTASLREELMDHFSSIAREYGISLAACAESEDFSRFGVSHARCIDGELLSQIGGVPLKTRKDKNQREACGCAESIDIGVYNSCSHGCLYCYANYQPSLIQQNMLRHHPASPFLLGEPEENDRITARTFSSLRDGQLSLFTNGEL